MTAAPELAEKRRVLALALPSVPFDGWTPKLLARAVAEAELDELDRRRLFPAGVADLVDFYLEEADREMLAGLARRELGALRVRERIAAAVRLRLEQAEPRREAVRRTLSHQALPGRGPRALRALYRTVDAIWRAAGDSATDFNFHSKRGLLAGVYAGTLLYWLNDDSEGRQDTWAFLERRIDGVMGLERLKGRLERAARRLPSPWPLIGRLRHRRRAA